MRVVVSYAQTKQVQYVLCMLSTCITVIVVNYNIIIRWIYNME